jgi:Outer membrane protein
MLHRITLVIALLSLIGVTTLFYFYLFASPKLVYVDSNKLINGYQGMLSARAEYQKKSAVWKSNIDSLNAEIQSRITDYEKTNSRMSKKEKDLSQELIKVKQRQLVDYQQATNAQAQQEDIKLTNDVITQMNAYLKKYGQEKGYKIIMAATDYGNIAYADDGLDITEEVLEGMNDEYSGN